jgi:hypothetical protein
MPTTTITLDEDNITTTKERLLALTGSSFGLSVGATISLSFTQAASSYRFAVDVLVLDEGKFAVTVPLGAAVDGPLEIEARAVSSSGASVVSAQTLQLDLLVSQIEITSVLAHANDKAIDVAGTSVDVAAGSSVSVKFTDASNTTVSKTAVVQADGSWSLNNADLTGLKSGAVQVTAQATDHNSRTIVSDTQQASLVEDAALPPVLEISAQIGGGNKLAISGISQNLADGTILEVQVSDNAGHAQVFSAQITDGFFTLTGLSTSMFTTTALHVLVSGEGQDGSVVNAAGDAYLPVPTTGDTPVMELEVFTVDQNSFVQMHGLTSQVDPGTVLQIVFTDTAGMTQVFEVEVDEGGEFDLSNVRVDTLAEGELTVDVLGQTSAGEIAFSQNITLVRNHAPEGADSTASATEDVLYAISASDFGFTDLDSHSMTGVKITALPANGELKLNGAAVTLDQVVSKADIDAGHLTFKAASNANGSNYASLQFKVQDSGSSHNEDTTANTLTFNVAAVNDAPTGSVTLSGTAKQGQTLTASHDLADADGMGSISYSWFANGVEISGATASTYTLTASEIGKTITAKASYTDGGNNATVVSSATTNAVVSSGVAGDGTISLGNNGQLIAPVQVEGKWYYYWHRAAEGSQHDYDQVSSHDVLDDIFKYDINGNERPADLQDTNDVYRYATINGVQVALPTVNGGQFLSNLDTIAQGTSASVGGVSIYDDFMAIWDTHNGADDSTGTFDGTPQGWTGDYYWTATTSPSGHVSVQMTSGIPVDDADSQPGYVALEVISTPNTAPVLDPTQSPAFIASQGAGVPAGEVGSLLSTLVSGISDTSPTAPKGIAITGFDTTNGTLYFSTNGGATWAAVGAVSNTNALLLAADSNTRLYFQPANSSYVGSTNPITFRAWDLTQHITEGVYANTVANGGKAEFSSATDTIAVDVHTAPVFSSSGSASVAENSVTSTVVYDANASLDGGSADAGMTYTLGGTDAGKFSINSSTGQVTFNTSPNFEAPTDSGSDNVYDFSVTATTALGVSRSKAVALSVSNANDSPTGAVSISGMVQVDQQLTASNNIADPDGTITGLGYQWQSSTDGSTWANISGATASTYTLTSNEQGKSVRAVASYTAGGFADNVAASATASVMAAPTVTISSVYGDTSSSVTDTFYTPYHRFNVITPDTTFTTAYWTVEDPLGLYWTAQASYDANLWVILSDSLELGVSGRNYPSSYSTKTFTFNGGNGFNSVSFQVGYGNWVKNPYVPITLNFYSASGSLVGSSSFTFAYVTGYLGTYTFSTSFSGAAKYFTMSSAANNSFALDTLSVSLNAGYISNGGSTADTTPSLSGSISRALATGEVVEVYRNGSKIGNASISVGSTSWSFTDPGAWLSSHSYTAKLATSGGTALATSSAYSVTMSSTPLVLDLNGDGVQTTARSGVMFDLVDAGSPQSVGWLSGHDGFLALDLNHDGRIATGAELFGNHTRLAAGGTASDGWQALAQYDSNHDSRIDAQDAVFDQLLVWQDINGNGVTDAGELASLAAHGIASINLNADLRQVEQNGNALTRFSSYTTVDGVTREMVDALLATQETPICQTVALGDNKVHLDLIGAGHSLNLSDLRVKYGDVTQVNLSGTGANTLKITLADVLQGAHLGGQVGQPVRLQVSGDADDTVLLNASEWLRTDQVVTIQDHSYVIYSAANASAAQLLIDQHMFLHAA